MQQFDGSWKNLYMEKFLQTYIENSYPNNMNLVELKQLLEMTNRYILSLNIEQLLLSDVEESQDDEVNHIDLNFILSSLPNLQVCKGTGQPRGSSAILFSRLALKIFCVQYFSLTCGVKNCSIEFSRNMFELGVTDCTNIGKGLQKSCSLQVYK